MDASVAVIMKLVNESRAADGLEGIGRYEVFEVRLSKRDKLALLMSERGGEVWFSEDGLRLR